MPHRKQKKTVKKPRRKKEPLAVGGGNATAAGVSFQAALGAALSVMALSERTLDARLNVGSASVRVLRFETEAPLDDILIETNQDGCLFVQAKTSLVLSGTLGSELGKTALQIVRQWRTCRDGDGRLGWNRPLTVGRDGFVIAVGPSASGSISADLAQALFRVREIGKVDEVASQAQKDALKKFTKLLALAWAQELGEIPSDQQIIELLPFITIMRFDFNGADSQYATELLGGCLVDSIGAASAFSKLARECERLMSTRSGSDAAKFRRTLEAAGVKMLAPPDYRADVAALRRFSDAVSANLAQHEAIILEGREVRVPRDCVPAIVSAASDGSLLIVGEPGAGKSAALSTSAALLRKTGAEVIELAVDRLPIAGLDGLRIELGLAHPLRSVLANWPGINAAYVFIDALDASRGGASESVFRNLIEDILSLSDRRWRIIASIRAFDLRLGDQFRQLFAGEAPDGNFAESEFGGVRHIAVREWNDTELSALLHQAPELGIAVAAGGDRVRDLARVPFNSRLLADLISGGLSPESFSALSRQVDLLRIYWRHRIEKFGAGAIKCLREVVNSMIATRELRSPYSTAADADVQALDRLLGLSVLVSVSGDRYVAFRHHILFDYAASRLYLDPFDVASLQGLFSRTNGVGLLLAPGLAYSLQELWTSSGPTRSIYWEAIIQIVSNPDCDPIARSVAARSACELCEIEMDVSGLIEPLKEADDPNDKSSVALKHLVGALAIRLEDGTTPVSIAPWAALAAFASARAGTEGPIRLLLLLLTKHVDAKSHRIDLGVAARHLLTKAFARSGDRYSPQLVAAAIGFVADTYDSDQGASRALLSEVFADERFGSYAHHEIPWVAERIKTIATIDADFATEIYAEVFSRDVSSTESTSIGNSQILPLTSNARQDYIMARFYLKEHFPNFLAEHPDEACDALNRSLEGYVALEHPLNSDAAELIVQLPNGHQAHLMEDMSYIWAWNPEDEHPDDAESLLQTLDKHLRTAPDQEARRIVERLIPRARLAVIWSRVLLAAASRPEALADLLWPLATQEAFVLCNSTRKDSIDLLAAAYRSRTRADRRSFEVAAISFDYSSLNDPQNGRTQLLTVLFGTIGKRHLVTTKARAFLSSSVEEGTAENKNERSFQITSSTESRDKWWWLRRAGVDVDLPENARLLEAAHEIEAALGLQVGKKPENIGDLAAAVESLIRLENLTIDLLAAGASREVTRVTADVIARGCTAILSVKKERLAGQSEVLDGVTQLTLRLTSHWSPEGTREIELAFGKSPGWSSPAPRVDAAENLMRLSRMQGEIHPKILGTIEKLLQDPHPAVRLTVAQRLHFLWSTDREAMWRLAGGIAEREHNRAVIAGFTNNFLASVRGADAERTEAVLLKIVNRIEEFPRDDEQRQQMRKDIGALIAILWIWNDCQASKKIAYSWCDNLSAYEVELGSAISSNRNSLTFGYGDDSLDQKSIRERGHQFLVLVVSAAAKVLMEFVRADPEERDGQLDSVRACAKLLDNACNQLYFASGAFQKSTEDQPHTLRTLTEKREFLTEVHEILVLIGGVGTPHTIYHLLQLLQFLLPADPEKVFDLVAHALLEGGRQHGYQYEAMGTEVFVKIIGLFLADHRDLFQDEQRRRRLVDCLEVFIEAGWPTARRLLYRLPELLR